MTTLSFASLLQRGRNARAPLLPAAALSAVLALPLAACKGTEAAQAPEQAALPPAPAAAAPAASGHEAPRAEPAAPASPREAVAPSIHRLKMTRLDGTPSALSDWAGKVVLVVNTASKCGYTPQYAGLQKLHARYSPRGFAVLGFPSNDFGGQEPGTSEEIAKFCTSIYAVNFPMFEKTKTVGPERSELYALLSDALGAPKWNFHKYLIDKQGRPVQAWESKVDPGSSEVASAIEAQLGAQ